LARRLERLRRLAKKFMKRPRGLIGFGKVNK